jgi:hypothetical protein
MLMILLSLFACAPATLEVEDVINTGDCKIASRNVYQCPVQGTLIVEAEGGCVALLSACEDDDCYLSADFEIVDGMLIVPCDGYVEVAWGR